MKKPTILLLLSLAGCVAPGKKDLESRGIKEKLEVKGNYSEIAKCVSGKFDNEEWQPLEYPTPVNSFQAYESPKSIEMAHIWEGSIYYWAINLQYVSAKSTHVEFTARKDINPYIRNTYLRDKIVSHLKACEGQ